MKEAIVQRVVQNWNMHGAIGVVLREKDGDRRFVFFVDHAVGNAIIHGLAGLPSSRPLTHDLLLQVLTTLKGTIQHVVITEAKEGMFYAKLVLASNGESHDLDSRPSDAVALAARTKVPIFVEEALFAQMATAQDLSKPVSLSVLWPLAENTPPAPHAEPSDPH